MPVRHPRPPDDDQELEAQLGPRTRWQTADGGISPRAALEEITEAIGRALAADEAALASPPQARGMRLLPPRDPYLQHPDRVALAPDPAVRKRLFRPVAGPGAVLQDGILSGLWRVRARGRCVELDVKALRPIRREELEAEAARVAELRGADAVVTRWR